MLLISLPVNYKLLAVEFLGSQKLNRDFQLHRAWCPNPCAVWVNCFYWELGHCWSSRHGGYHHHHYYCYYYTPGWKISQINLIHSTCSIIQLWKYHLSFRILIQNSRPTFVIIIIPEYWTTVCSVENVVIYSNSIIRGIEEPQVVHKRTGND